MKFNSDRRAFPALGGILGTLATLFFLTFGAAAFGQAADGTLLIPDEIDVTGRGWEQILNLVEMLDFGLCLVEVSLLVSLLAFHPVNIRHRTNNHVGEFRKGIYLFALIGMITGFLVVHHGYLIGFVIFGIGGLFRFRMESSSISDTAQMVVGALVGLAVGLDLPVMGLVGALAAYVVLYVFGKDQSLTLEVLFNEGQFSREKLDDIRNHLSGLGFQTISVSKGKFKPAASFMLTARMAEAQSALTAAMTDWEAREDSGVADWHIA